MTETKKSAAVIVLEVGKQKKRAIKSLRSGVGELVDEAVATAESAAPAGKAIQPVVILFEKRGKGKRRRGLIERIVGRL